MRTRVLSLSKVGGSGSASISKTCWLVDLRPELILHPYPRHIYVDSGRYLAAVVLSIPGQDL